MQRYFLARPIPVVQHLIFYSQVLPVRILMSHNLKEPSVRELADGSSPGDPKTGGPADAGPLSAGFQKVMRTPTA
jgi:hypothetical protein